MKKKLAEVKTDYIKKYYNILGEACGSQAGAEWSSKHFLVKEQLRSMNVVMDDNTRCLMATCILELEKNGVIRIDFDKMDKRRNIERTVTQEVNET